MAKITLTIDDLQPNQAITVSLNDLILYEYEEDPEPDPGEEDKPTMPATVTRLKGIAVNE